MAEQAPLLEVKNLRVEFPTRRGTLVAVDAVSFAIGRGEVLGVVGESGAGKSLTGMAVIGLLERPGRIAAGEIRLAGERIDNLPAEALRRIRARTIEKRLLKPDGTPTFNVRFYALNVAGEHAAMAMYAGGDPRYALCDEAGPRLVAMDALLSGSPLD